MADAGVDQYTFHIEPVSDVATVCRKINEAGMKVNIHDNRTILCMKGKTGYSTNLG